MAPEDKYEARFKGDRVPRTYRGEVRARPRSCIRLNSLQPHGIVTMDHRGPTIFKRVRRYNIPGHIHFLTFSCYQRLPLLTNDTWCGWLADAVKQGCLRQDFALWAYVFMPEHVHLLVRPLRDDYNISDFLRAVKQPVAARALSVLKKEKSPLLGRLRISEESRGPAHRFWQAGGRHDLNIWSLEKAEEKARYCHRNPVSRGLVIDPEDWFWSSYQWVELGLTEDQPLQLDAWTDWFRD